MKGLRIGIAALAFAFFGCGDSDTGGGGSGLVERPTCDEIGSTCHHSTTVLGQECHEFGHDETSTEQDCKDRYEECMAECQGSGGGHGH